LRGMTLRYTRKPKRVFWLYHFYAKISSFYQDRLGTNIGKTPKTTRFCRSRYSSTTQCTSYATTIVLSHLCRNAIFLPRQARDKHRESTQNRYCRFLTQVHSPLCVPEAFLEKFSFIADADDNVNHDRQYVAAMVNYLDAVVGNVARALQDAGLWNNTLCDDHR
jgi:hypothetical protein